MTRRRQGEQRFKTPHPPREERHAQSSKPAKIPEAAARVIERGRRDLLRMHSIIGCVIDSLDQNPIQNERAASYADALSHVSDALIEIADRLDWVSLAEASTKIEPQTFG